MIWVGDQITKVAFWLVFGAFLAQLFWIPIKRFLPVPLAAEPIVITEVQRDSKRAALGTTVILKTP